jgi:hypothetical protein
VEKWPRFQKEILEGHSEVFTWVFRDLAISKSNNRKASGDAPLSSQVQWFIELPEALSTEDTQLSSRLLKHRQKIVDETGWKLDEALPAQALKQIATTRPKTTDQLASPPQKPFNCMGQSRSCIPILDRHLRT